LTFIRVKREIRGGKKNHGGWDEKNSNGLYLDNGPLGGECRTIKREPKLILEAEKV
jgi:hypothetical protein